MLKKLKLQAGTYPSSDENLEIELSPVTVFIGPNNSGKSQALIEIKKKKHEFNFVLFCLEKCV